ncbi:MAG: surface protein [Flavipsychrobacter sp.]|nr:surface protein [Flavipsychrobacter sp.]
MKKIFSLVLLGMLFSIASSRAQCPITGPDHLCVGQSFTYTTICDSGIWISSFPSIITINPVTGAATAVAAGVDTIKFQRFGTGPSMKLVTVHPTPAISGPTVVCTGNFITLVATPPGGTWSSACPTVLTITPTSGMITGVGVGTCVVTYTSAAGCKAQHTVRDSNCVVLDSIIGPSRACAGSVVSFFNSTSGGTWSSSNTAVATINPTTGVATAISAGTTNIIYTVGTTSISMVFTVGAIPTISGPSTVCVGNSITLTHAGSGGGTWTSSSTAIASVTSGGVVTGMSAGVAIITYVETGCLATRAVTVTAGPALIGGPSTVGISSTITLTNATSGGIWSSSNTSIAMIGSTSGITTGISTGVVTISYTVAGCSATKTVTVTSSSTIAPIMGSSSVCVSSSTLLTNATPGGTWSTSNPSVATVSATGLVTGVSAGTVTITYTVGSSFATKLVTVYSGASISGPGSLCVGSTITLTATPTGGTWTSSAPTIASVGSSGVVTGMGSGTAIIYYLAAGCNAYKVVTVTPAPAPIAGVATTTVGGTSTLSDATAGGTWSSSNTAIATVSASTGLVTGIAAGTCTITYTLPSGCFRTITFIVTPAITVIGPIVGPSSTCVGTSITLTDSTAGGTWSSSNPSVATVSSTGVVTGVAAGTVTITYTVGASFVTKLVTITASASIGGPSTVCIGASITLSGTPTGGTWTSSSTAIASVTTTGGSVTGMSAGVVTITYTAGGCIATKLVTVTASPTTISGTTTATIGGISTLSSTPAGGTWTSSNTSIATVNPATGVVTGVAAGTCTITYTLASGCFRTITFVVTGSTTLPPIGGPSSTCVGSSITLTNSVTGGTWSSSNTAIATVNAAGVVTGVSAGTVTITYTVGSSFVTKIITVSSGATITGSSSVCIGSSTALAGSPSGGTWASSNPSVATISSTGVVTGVAGGIVNIYYSSGGCSAFRTVTVSTSAVISGSSSLCLGSTTSLTATPTGGTWSTSNPAIATVSPTGLVTAIATGVVNIYYASSGCYTYKSVTVNTAAAITGSSTVCIGSTITLTATPGGGTWTSSSTAIASVSATGVVTGMSAGTATITYTNGGCTAVKVITVGAGSLISGGSAVCIGSVLTLSGSPTGGIWTSSNTAIATVSSTGVVSPVSAGVVTISYSAGSSCIATRTVTVSAAAAIIGTSTVCVGGTITLTATPGGGTWISSDSSKAIVSSTGVVSGLATGVVTIYYTSGGCSASRTVTVTPGAIISGGGSVMCVGSSMSLSATPSGGAWSSSNTTVAVVTSTGLVTATGVGVVNIYYAPTSGCTTYRTVTVSASAVISGSSTVCPGSSITLGATPSGGSWTSSNTAIATVSSTGMVTGVSGGVVTITYAAGGCAATKLVTVSAVSISGGGSGLCVGATMSLTGSPTGGTWSSSDTTKAWVSSSGVVTGLSSGSVIITYTLGGCRATRTIAISGSASITGSSTVCTGSSITLTGSPTGGIWTTSSTAIAAVSSSGVVTGMSTGVATITYTSGGCSATKLVTVTAGAVISGSSSMCLGTTMTLAATPTGGTWSSSNTAIATVNSAGVVSGVSTGVVNITYAPTSGCAAVRTVTVNGSSAITGSSSTCVGSSVTLSSTPSGGIWATSSSTIATVSSSGVVTGLAPGVVNIYYALGGCYASKTMTITATPVITGTVSICIGSTGALSATPSGGTWTSSATAIASVSATGVITGMSAGTATITYSVGSCFATRTVTITPGSSTITGGSTVCLGSTLTLTGSPSGGTWASGYTGTATVSSTGVVTGVGVGVVTVYYAVGGCYAYRSITVNPVPAAIVGASTVCTGSSIMLSDPTPGGTWTSSSTAIASVTSTGLVNGMSVGVATISYTVAGCRAVKPVTVHLTPAAITGGSTVTTGGTLSLSSATPGGTWTSTNPSRATVHPTSGLVTGVASGTVNINYAIGPCNVFKTITVTGPLGPLTPDVNPTEASSLSEMGSGSSAAKNTATNKVASLSAEAVLSVYPNPTSGNVNVKWENQETGACKLVVSDIIGREVYHTTLNINEASGETQVNLSDLKDGIYMIMLKSESIHYSGRLIIRQ